MIKIIKPRREVFVEEFYLAFKTDQHSGYYFPCTSRGEVVELAPEAKSNYEKCVRGEIKTICTPFVKHERSSHIESAIGECECGQHFDMDIDNEGICYCYCGKSYNGAGQSIRPRSEWEEQYDDNY